jgi:hypothetical protein
METALRRASALRLSSPFLSQSDTGAEQKHYPQKTTEGLHDQSSSHA